MHSTQALITGLDAAFNARDIDSALSRMSDAVSWPRASEGGRVVGKQEIRAYWTRQWQQFDPHVTPVDVIDRGPGERHTGEIEVRVHQIVSSLLGDVLSDSEVPHVHTIAGGLIERMDIHDLKEDEAGESPSSAFRIHRASPSRDEGRKGLPFSPVLQVSWRKRF